MQNNEKKMAIAIINFKDLRQADENVGNARDFGTEAL